MHQKIINDEKYTVDYFIKKFEAIPEDKWYVGKFFGPEERCCAVGHCALPGNYKLHPFQTPEGLALMTLFQTYKMSVYSTNDGEGELRDYECFMGTGIPFTPKSRIIRALKWIKERIEEEPV